MPSEITLKHIKDRCKVDPRSECWIWQQCVDSGHGRLRVNGKVHYAHRLAYTLAKGPIPDGMEVLSECHNGRCCNPNHLFLSTRLNRIKIMARLGRPLSGIRRSIISRKSARAMAKLDMGKAREIRRRAVNGEDKDALAAAFGVSEFLIRQVLAHKRWKESGLLMAV